jgi:hypothetical protein
MSTLALSEFLRASVTASADCRQRVRSSWSQPYARGAWPTLAVTESSPIGRPISEAAASDRLPHATSLFTCSSHKIHCWTFMSEQNLVGAEVEGEVR